MPKFYKGYDFEGTRGLGITTVESVKKINLARQAISQAAMRARQIEADEELKRLEQTDR